jgi:hypothetical protein
VEIAGKLVDEARALAPPVVAGAGQIVMPDRGQIGRCRRHDGFGSSTVRVRVPAARLTASGMA